MPTKPYRMPKAAPNLDAFAEQQLNRSEQLRRNEDLDSARKICKKLLLLFPNDDQVLFQIGLILSDMEKYNEADKHLSKAESLYPNNWKILTILSTVRLNLHNHDDAWSLIRRASKLAPHDVYVKTGMAEIYSAQRNYEAAIKILKIVIRKEPQFHRAKIILADSYLLLGDMDRAASLYHEMLAEGYRSLPILERLVRLPGHLLSADVFPLLRQLGGSPNIDRTRFLFSCALAHHQAGRHEEAWTDLVAANQIQHRLHAGTWQSTLPAREAALEYARNCSVLEPPARLPADHPVSLFILGPSRSGKSTLEGLLGLLPGVARGYESRITDDALRRAAERSNETPRPGEYYYRLPPGAFSDRFRDFYLADVKEKAGTSLVFSNTSPALISKIMDLTRIVPGSRFVFIRRNEADLLLRIYMQLYRWGNTYAYDIKTIKNYIDWYGSITDLFANRFPETSRVVSYEDMVDNPDRTISTVAQLCGIDGVPRSSPKVGDDRGVSRPYRTFIGDALKHGPLPHLTD